MGGLNGGGGGVMVPRLLGMTGDVRGKWTFGLWRGKAREMGRGERGV